MSLSPKYKYTVEHKGKIANTNNYMNLTSDECEQIRTEYYKKPNIALVKRELHEIYTGRTTDIPLITKYYLKDLMAKVRIHHSKWSIEECLENDDIIRFLMGKTIGNKDIYSDRDDLITKFETVLRLGSKGITAKPSNFPIKECKRILKEYNVNDNYYDFSCGWSARMLSSMSTGLNYFGTDPNYLLTERINEMYDILKDMFPTLPTSDIRTQGSQVFVPEWENKIGLAFSSPPYFMLEDYRVGEQSCNEDTNYQDWLDGYLTGTLTNIHKYLIFEGNLLVNIKGYKNFDLVCDTIKTAESVGFEYKGTTSLSNISRPLSKSRKGELLDTDEDVMLFRKIGSGDFKPKKQSNIYDW